MYICVDFDGTIVDHRYPEIGPPVDGAIYWIKQFQSLGAKIILFTMRSDNQSAGNVLTEAVNYLESEGIKLFGINHNPDQSAWTTSPKAYGDIYIDDAAFGCPLIQPVKFQRSCVDWSSVGPEIEKKLLSNNLG
ncbi:MAG TPA: hypothetical protein EYQ42_12770 [Thiotrichaceae bacterium]|jgi:hypothetical protein|nr:hypothetical protein [Thiotrichaceae bacterium]